MTNAQDFDNVSKDVWERYVRQAEFAQNMGIKEDLDTIELARLLWWADIKYGTSQEEELYK